MMSSRLHSRFRRDRDTPSATAASAMGMWNMPWITSSGMGFRCGHGSRSDMVV